MIDLTHTRHTWTMVIVPDPENPRPDTTCEGYWPSRDPDAPGYCPPEQFDKSLSDATRRMTEWEAGDWYHIGVMARLHVDGLMIESPGIWGIESDDESYIAEQFECQKLETLAILKGIAQ